MYDYIRINKNFIPPAEAYSGNPFEFRGLIWNPIFRNGEASLFESEIGNLDLKLNMLRQQLTVTNSFHTFLKGSNNGDFTLSEMVEVKNMLSEQLGSDLGTGRVSKLEYGCNIITGDLEGLYKPLISLRNKPYQNSIAKGKVYGKSLPFKQYTVKAYNKTVQLKIAKGIKLDNDISRWEVKVNDLSYLRSKKIPIIELNDILLPHNARLLANDLEQKYLKSIKACIYDLSSLTMAERKAYWLHFYEPSREDIKDHSPKTYERNRAIFNSILNKLTPVSHNCYGDLIGSKCMELIEN